MTHLIKLEAAALFGLSFWLFTLMPFEGWWFWVLLLAPDMSMLGYIFGKKAGAISYNIFHHQALAVILFLLGWYLYQKYLQLAGVILLAHSNMDRFFGYGLKTFQGFGFTHLGRIGKDKNT